MRKGHCRTAARQVICTLFVAIPVLAACVIGCSSLPKERDVLFQTSTISALMEGVYDGDTTFGILKKHGDFGLGTFNGLDGEMIGLDGRFYQIDINGEVYAVPDEMKTPFAVVTFFKGEESVRLERELDYEGWRRYLDSRNPERNLFFAVRVDGIFSYMKTRSVPRQKKPYPPLLEAVKHQRTFEFHHVRGTVVGFRCPDYVKGVNVPGYHLHFISQDRKAGGHILDFRTENVRIQQDCLSRFYMVLPESAAFLDSGRAGVTGRDLETVEGK